MQLHETGKYALRFDGGQEKVGLIFQDLVWVSDCFGLRLGLEVGLATVNWSKMRMCHLQEADGEWKRWVLGLGAVGARSIRLLSSGSERALLPRREAESETTACARGAL